MTIGMRYLLDCLRYGIPIDGAEGDAVYIDASVTLVVTCPDGMGGVEVHRPARPALALGVLKDAFRRLEESWLVEDEPEAEPAPGQGEYDPSVEGLT